MFDSQFGYVDFECGSDCGDNFQNWLINRPSEYSFEEEETVYGGDFGGSIFDSYDPDTVDPYYGEDYYYDPYFEDPYYGEDYYYGDYSTDYSSDYSE